MTPEKCLHATKHGIATLQKHILPLRAQLKKLESAQTYLSNMRYEADLHSKQVKVIPIGMTKKKLEEEERKFMKEVDSIYKAVEEMGDEELNDLLDKLERRINRDG